MRSLAAVAVVLGFAVSAHAEPLDIRVSGHLALHPIKPGVTATPVLVNSHTPYFEVMVAGTAGQLNAQRGGQGILGIADYACQQPGNCYATYISNGLVFAFANDPYYNQTGNPVLEICGTAAQEIAHAWTLDHAVPTNAPMTYNNYTSPLTFAINVVCGSDCGQYNGCSNCNAFGVTCTAGGHHTCMST